MFAKKLLKKHQNQTLHVIFEKKLLLKLKNKTNLFLYKNKKLYKNHFYQIEIFTVSQCY